MGPPFTPCLLKTPAFLSEHPLYMPYFHFPIKTGTPHETRHICDYAEPPQRCIDDDPTESLIARGYKTLERYR